MIARECFYVLMTTIGVYSVGFVCLVKDYMRSL